MKKIIYCLLIVFFMLSTNTYYAMTIAGLPVEKESPSRIENSISRFRENMKETTEQVDFTDIIEPKDFKINVENRYSNPYFELVSPAINSNDDVIQEKELLISVKFLENIDATMSLIKLNNPRSMASLSKTYFDLENILNNAPVSTDSNLSEEELKVVDPVAVVDFSEIENLEKYDELTLLYEKSIRSLILSHDSFVNVLKNEISKGKHTEEELQELVSKRQLLVNGLVDLYESRKLYEVSARNYKYIKEKYENYGSKTILDSIPMVRNGVLPYFNTIVSLPAVGKYQLIINDSKGDILGEVIEFYIKDEKTLTQDYYNVVKKQVKDIKIPN